MLRRVLVVLIGLSWVSMAGEAHFGGRVGMTLSRFHGDDADDNDLDEESMVGFVGGAYLAYEFNDFIAVQPEALFSMKGAETEGSAGSGALSVSWDYRIRLTYLEIPILLRVSAPPSLPLRPMVYAGIAPALLVTADVDGEMAGLIAYDHSDDVRSDFDPVDLGIPVGGTVTFKGGPVTFVLDVRYTFGVLEIYDEDDFENEEEPEMRNAVFSFTVGAGL